MVEHSEWTDPNESIHQVIHEIPSSSPIASRKEAEATEGTSTSDDPVAAEITPKSPAVVVVNSTPAIQKPVRGSQLKKVTTPAVAAPSPPATRSAARKKGQEQRRAKGNDPPLGSLSETEAQVESNEGQTEPRRSLWPVEMASISAPKEDGGRESGAFSNIIHTYTMKFENNKLTPKIPLCRLVQFTRVRQFQTTSLQTEALKKSFETHCYMEHFAAFHVSMFDENGNKMLVTDEDKAGWDMLWRMESQDFDEECSKILEYQHLVNKKFSTWDGNHRLITWMQVLSTPLSEYKEMIGSDVYEEFERARQKSPGKTAWYDENMTSSAAAYILSFGEVSAAKDAQLVAEEEAKKQGKPLSSKQKKDMWDARVKEVCASWSSQVFKYATVVNPSLGPDFLAVVRELRNSLARVEKSKHEVAHSVGLDRVKAFASAGIHNSLKIELLKVHYSDEKTREKYHHPTKFDVDNDLRPWLAQWALWSSLELRLDGEVDRFRQYFEDTRDTYWTSIWYPVEDRQDVQLNIKRAKRLVFRYFVWHLQTEKAHACFLLWRNLSHKLTMYDNQDTLCIGFLTLSDWKFENCPWWLEQPCDDEHVKCVGDAEQVCWDKILKEEDPFNVSHDWFESGEEDEVLTQAEFVEPSKNIDGLVLDTSRTKKQKEARQSSKAEEEEETGGSTPTGKAKEQPKPGSGKFCLNPRLSSGVRRKFDWLIAETISSLNSIREGRTRSAKKQTKDKAPKQSKKKRDEPAEAEPVLEDTSIGD
ncbi:hypothetical protein R1sor_026920 [Riccia sorocarpa]|uniref:Uncharacterized protein n=1 Tax=Riccia sorocarpa TaxID=122646 RepID=A0ABD3GFM7_9MARC